MNTYEQPDQKHPLRWLLLAWLGVVVRLGISLRTVGAHLTSIYTKLGVDSRASAVATAIAHGLLQQKG